VIKAIGYAVQGMQHATRQANNAAERILQSTTSAFNPPVEPTTEPTTTNNTGPVRTATRDLVAPSADNLVYDIVDLKNAEHNFKLNAAVYKRMSDMTDEFLNNIARGT